jgi:GxxExxY protein
MTSDTDELLILTEGHGEGVSRHEKNLLHYEITRPIIGSLFDVHREFGPGFAEAVYANSVCVNLRKKGLRVEREVPFEITYLGDKVGFYRADIIVESKVIVEVKSVRLIHPAHEAQVINYMRASGIHVGLILNFGYRPAFRRLVA